MGRGCWVVLWNSEAEWEERMRLCERGSCGGREVLAWVVR